MRVRTRPFALLLGALALVATACPPEGGNPPGSTTTTTTSTTTTVPADPADRFVATTGADVGDCSTEAAACLTINYAVAQAVAGDRIAVAAGAYDEIVVPNKDLTFEGANVGVLAGTAAEVRGAESTVKGFRTAGNPGTTPYAITIDGFRIDPQGDAALIGASLQPLVWLYGGNTVIRSNVFSGGAYVANCSFNCSTMTDSAFTVQSGSVLFLYNTVENFRRPVAINQVVGAPATSATVSANRFVGITSRAISLAGSTGVQMGGQQVIENEFDATGRVAPSSPAGVTISNAGNEVSGNTFTGFASGVYVDMCKKFLTTDNDISDNTFSANAAGVNISVNTDGGQCVSSTIEGESGWVVGAGTVDGLTVNRNNFDLNTSYAIRHAAYNWGFFTAVAPTSSNLDATCNFYSDEAGPNYVEYSYPPGTVAANPDGIIGTAAPETQLDFTPWLTAAIPGGACDGGV